MREQALRVLDDAQPGRAGQVPVGEHEVERLALEQRERLVAVLGGRDVVALAEVVGDELPPRALDLDDEHAARRDRRRPPSWRRLGLGSRELLVAPRERAPDPEAQVLDVSDGLLDVVVRADVERLDGRVVRRVARDEHDRGRGRERARRAQHVEPRRARQVLVGEHEVEAPLVHQIDGLLGAGGRRHAVAAAPQRLAQHGEDDGLVVDDEHLVARGHDGRVRARRGLGGDEAHVDVAVGRGRARALVAREDAVAREDLDDAHAQRLAVPPLRGRGRDAPERRQRGARQVGARATVERVAQPLRRGRVVDDDDGGAGRPRARLGEPRVEAVALAELHDDGVRRRGIGRLRPGRCAPAARPSSSSPSTTIEGASREATRSSSSAAARLGVDGGELGADAREGVEHELAARARPPEAHEALDVGAQQRVDLGQRARQHGRDLAPEGVAADRRDRSRR